MDASDIEEAQEQLDELRNTARDGIWASAEAADAFRAIERDDVDALQKCLVRSAAAWALWRDEDGRDMRTAAKEDSAEKARAREATEARDAGSVRERVHVVPRHRA